MLAWLMNMGFAGGRAPLAGPYKVAAKQLFTTGATAGQAFHTGQDAGQSFHTGAEAGQIGGDR
jgi:hypothetical protein